MRRTKKQTGPGQSRETVAWANASSWLKRRRENVKAAVKSNGHCPNGSKQVRRLASAMWSQDHQKERNRSSEQEKQKRDLV